MKTVVGVVVAVVLLTSRAGAVGLSRAPGDYVILGLEEVTLRHHVQVLTGDVGCNAADGRVRLQAASRVAGVVAAHTVLISSGAGADQLFCNSLERRSSSGPACDAMATPIVEASSLPPVQVDPGQEDVRVRRLGKLTLPTPASGEVARYDTIRVSSRAELRLQGGDYAVRSIKLGRRARLICETPCHIAVEEGVHLREHAEINRADPGTKQGIRIDIEGDGGPGPAFWTYRYAIVVATVYAPNGGIVLGGSGHYAGAFVARTVLVYERSVLELFSAL